MRAFGGGVAGASQTVDGIPPKPKGRILVADSDRAFRTTIAAVLRANGCDVVDLANGFELLHILQGGSEGGAGSGGFDLAICDARLSGKTGLHVFSLVGNAPVVPPVVFTTTTQDKTVLDEAQRLGALSVIEKPVDIDALLALIDGLAARGSA